MSLIEKLREPRIFGMAIFDLFSAIVGTALIFKYLGHSYMLGALWAVPIGILSHWLFNINTSLNGRLGLNKEKK